ncbi:DUF899 family protein [Micromonospora sp. ATA32]|nr:DUF899 family protein [Micromonospora sp. ATA32]
MEKPTIVSAEEWQQAHDVLLKAEKEATRALDALAARRRRLPMVAFADRYAFDSPTGPKTLLDLFDGRGQLVVYQFMDAGPDHHCPGCLAAVSRAAPGRRRRSGTGRGSCPSARPGRSGRVAARPASPIRRSGPARPGRGRQR